MRKQSISKETTIVGQQLSAVHGNQRRETAIPNPGSYQHFAERENDTPLAKDFRSPFSANGVYLRDGSYRCENGVDYGHTIDGKQTDPGEDQKEVRIKHQCNIESLKSINTPTCKVFEDTHAWRNRINAQNKKHYDIWLTPQDIPPKLCPYCLMDEWSNEHFKQRCLYIPDWVRKGYDSYGGYVLSMGIKKQEQDTTVKGILSGKASMKDMNVNEIISMIYCHAYFQTPLINTYKYIIVSFIAKHEINGEMLLQGNELENIKVTDDNCKKAIHNVYKYLHQIQFDEKED